MILNNNCFIIAEAGVNHNGAMSLAKELIDAAAGAGADAVKFQTFKADLITTPTAIKARYQIENTGNDKSQYEMLKELELSLDQYHELFKYSKSVGIKFLSTPFDVESLKELVSMGVETLKISSGDITNALLLLRAAQSELPIIISTGASDLGDIRNALAVLAFGYRYTDSLPKNHAECLNLLSDKEATAKLKDKVTVLHCTTNYPALFNEINLSAMHTIKEAFNLRVGYSDHSTGILVPTIAVALGASVIEKHFTIDKSLPGPDHKASLNPGELEEMVRNIRDTELILGSQVKSASETELLNKKVVRRGIYASSDIVLSEKFTLDNIVTLRPENSTSPLELWDLLGNPAQKNYKKYDTI